MGTRFIVPPGCLRGRTAAILASGASLTQAQCDAVRAADIFTVCVSDAYLLAPWCHALWSTDARWWTHESHKDVWTLSALKVSLDPLTPREVCVLNCTGETGHDDDPANVRSQNNGGGAALDALIHARPARVILLGFDYHVRNAAHFFGDHPRGLRTTEPSAFARWNRNAHEVAPIYAKLGVDIVNGSPDSDLTAFLKSSLAEELAR